jgi:hypothetical protein
MRSISVVISLAKTFLTLLNQLPRYLVAVPSVMFCILAAGFLVHRHGSLATDAPTTI